MKAALLLAYTFIQCFCALVKSSTDYFAKLGENLKLTITQNAQRIAILGSNYKNT